jgi:hypothetical protein
VPAGFGSLRVNKERSVMPWVRENIEAKNMRREMRNTKIIHSIQ